MKKLLVAVFAALLMTACGGPSDKDVNEAVQNVEQLGAQAKSAINKDANLKALMDKQSKGEELTEDEKLTLIQKLKKIAAEVVVGDKNAEQGAKDAASAVKNSDELKNATKDTQKKVEEAQKKVDDTKKAVDDTKKAVDDTKKAAEGVIDALNNLKK